MGTDSALRATVAAAVLDAARWKADMVITNHFGERVWLRQSTAEEKERCGYGFIIDCCEVDAPCDHHRQVADGGHK